LYSDGPVDLPVTIAKLDSPDTQRVTVEVGSSSSFAISSNFLVSGSPLYAGSGLAMRITGSSGAVDIEQTPNLIAYVVDTVGVDLSSQTVVNASSDGSFEIVMPFDDDYEILFAGLSEDESFASPFLRVIQQKVANQVPPNTYRENYVLVTTNSNVISSAQSLMSDSSGYYYLSLDTNATTHSFLRRNIDGSQSEFIIENDSEIVDHVAAYSEQKIAYVNDSGQLRLVLPSTTSSSLSLTTGGAEPLHSEIVSYSKTLTTLTSYTPDATKIAMNNNEDAVVVSQTDPSYPAVSYVRTVSGSVVPIIRSTWYDEIKTAFSVGASKLYAFVLFEGNYYFYSANLASSVTTAWSNRTTLDDTIDFTAIHSLDASENGVVAIDVDNNLGQRTLEYWTQGTGFTAISDSTSDSHEYVNPKVTADGAYIIACQLGINGNPNQFVYHQPGVDAFSEFHAITNTSDKSVCDESEGSYFISPHNNFLHFYRTETDGTLPQHAVINLDQLE
jgi:hypothetical protein